jgi:hypothetical protein
MTEQQGDEQAIAVFAGQDPDEYQRIVEEAFAEMRSEIEAATEDSESTD